MAYIERLEVEAEGFLSGLDIKFTPGLNVIVGARGTGKTSIVELLRFALGADAFTKKAAETGEQQARAILDGGAVTVTLRDGDSRFTVTRSASMVAPRFESSQINCTVLAQNEMEAVGAQKVGRLALVDRFRVSRDTSARQVAALEAQLRTTTREISDVLREIELLADNSAAVDSTSVELLAARQVQISLLDNSQATTADQERLQQLQSASQKVSARAEVIASAATSAANVSSTIRAIIETANGTDSAWPESAGKDVFEDARRARAETLASLQESLALAEQWGLAVDTQRMSNEQLRATIESQSRELRQSLELLKAGMSQAAQRVAELEERVGQLAATVSRLSQRQAQARDLIVQRDHAYEMLEALRQDVFEERAEIANALNERLGPTVRVELTKSAGIDDYVGAVVGAIRGSGLHYNTLGPLIASNVAPFELVRWVEDRNSSALAQAVGIAPDRASVVLETLRTGTSDLIASRILDEVELKLLDGQEYKSSDRLSIGQRCTVVLPLLLGHQGDPLILDQPEDHLDNAFVAFTLVPALVDRTSEDQYIFTSHNANIPVLGGADNVIVMGSDGDRGFVDHAGELDSAPIVESIKRIMEGGVEAFAARARFYSSQGQ